MKKLPLGKQTFSEIIEKNNLYVDKTKDIYNLLNGNSKYYFLSRPRRFGKSLLISTLNEIFAGNKELFKDLWIYDKIEWKKYPVIKIDFSSINYTEGKELFKESLTKSLQANAQKYNIQLSENNFKQAFKELIINLSKIEDVVILIDEYDKPIIEYVDNLQAANENREVLKQFYETIKASDQYIRFTFLTGVSKFAKVSVFSGLNNLTDITLQKEFATMLGYTRNELLNYFPEYISSFANEQNLTNEDLADEIRYWYNGYSWDAKNFVYNPYSILSLFTNKKISNYWFTSGTPTFLIKTIRQNKFDIANIDNNVVSEYVFDSYEIDNIDVESLLFQTGYLTVKKIEEKKRARLYTLGIPNFEVRESLFNYLLADLTEQSVAKIQPVYLKMLDALESENIGIFIKELVSLFSGIPYTLHIEKEAYYHSVFYLILSLMGIEFQPEEMTVKGRIDGVLELDEIVYILEFKYGAPGSDQDKLLEKAINQILEKKYYQSYLNKNKKINFLAVVFIDKEISYKAVKGEM